MQIRFDLRTITTSHLTNQEHDEDVYLGKNFEILIHDLCCMHKLNVQTDARLRKVEPIQQLDIPANKILILMTSNTYTVI